MRADQPDHFKAICNTAIALGATGRRLYETGGPVVHWAHRRHMEITSNHLQMTKSYRMNHVHRHLGSCCCEASSSNQGKICETGGKRPPILRDCLYNVLPVGSTAYSVLILRHKHHEGGPLLDMMATDPWLSRASASPSVPSTLSPDD